MFEFYIIERKRLRGTATYLWVILKRYWLFWYKPLKFTRIVEKAGKQTIQKDRILYFRNEDAAHKELDRIEAKGEIQKKAVNIDFGTSQTLWIARS
jgi:hypothetical protein